MGELLNDEHEVALSEEMAQILEDVPSATKKIAGKSLPIEVLSDCRVIGENADITEICLAQSA